jgi:hypothetical protein
MIIRYPFQGNKLINRTLFIPILLFLIINIACAQDIEFVKYNNLSWDFIHKLQIIENKTSIIDQLSPDEQAKLIEEARNLQDLSRKLMSKFENNADLASCTDASEALINFIQATIKVNKHARQDWEDYSSNKEACLISLRSVTS